MNVRHDPSWPTNYHDWYHDIGAADHNVALWTTFHERYYNDFHELESMPWWQKVDKIFIVGQEATHVDWVHKDPRIWVWDARYLPDLPRFHSFWWWWWQTVEVEKYQLATKRLLDPRTSAPAYYFECAVRPATRPHRSFLIDAIRQCPLLTTCCLTKGYVWMFGTDLEETNEVRSVGTSLRYGHGDAVANNSTFIPYRIYNNTWFSVLSETCAESNFFTEKTAKLLLGRRMFVAVGAVNLLQELRAMGFETFGSVLDESYDSVPDNTQRWNMAMSQVEKICQQDPLLIYQKILPILEHNRQHLLRMDLRLEVMKQMIDVLRIS